MQTHRRTRDRLRAEDGAISIMAGVLAVAMIMATSLAVDVGRVAYASRDQQGVTDRDVLDALRHVGAAVPAGSTIEQVHAAVTASVEDTMEGNTEGSSVGTARDRTVDNIEIGYTHPDCVYDPVDPQPDDPADFCVMYSNDGPGPHYAEYDPTPGYGEPVTTVRVITSSAVDYLFAFLDDDGYRDVVKEAIGTVRRVCVDGEPDCPPPPPPPSGCPASDPDCDEDSDDCIPPAPDCPTPVDAEAGFSVRSRLVELNTADSALNDDRLALLRDVLGDLIGLPGPTSVTAVGFDGLATAEVPLGVLGDAGATVGTTTQLLDSQVNLADLFTAMASGATSDDAAATLAAESALTTLATEVDPALTVRVGDMLATTTEDPSALLTGHVRTLDLVIHAAMNAAVANGNHLVDVDLTGGTLGDPLFALDGLLEVAATLEIIEGPQMAHGPVAFDSATGRYETIARTAQVELDVDVTLNGYYAEDLLGPLEDLLATLLCTLGPLLCPEETVSIQVSAADAEAELAGIECEDPLEESDLETVVTSDALVATVSGGDETLVDSRDPSSGTVVVPTVPGEGTTTIDNTASLTNIPTLDEELTSIFGLLGVDLGTARVASHVVDCDVPVLLPNPL